MSDLSGDEARALIRFVQISYGYYPDGKRPPPQTNGEADTIEFLQDVAKLATQVHDLHKAQGRFLYELIQNAEDASYKKRRGNTDPQLLLRLESTKLVLESNEDGFTEEDFRALCVFRRSSKKMGEHIGKKGTGFMSVFNIAKKVHIQSGSLSFSFDPYENELKDLPMSVPMEEPIQELGPGVGTRMTFFLAKASDFAQRESELRELNGTTLLFLTKLMRLKIEICPSSEETTLVEHSLTRTKERATVLRQSYTMISGMKVNPKESRSVFLMTKETLEGIPSDSKEVQSTDSVISIAFPLDQNEEPHDPNDATANPFRGSHNIFSFLPVCRADLEFFVQADFALTASREDLLATARNDYLRTEIAHLFVRSILTFLDNYGSLQYTWLRFLPKPEMRDEFWSELGKMITELLKDKKVLFDWNGDLDTPGGLHYLPDAMKDENKQPLFEDGLPSTYLNANYKESDISFLQAYGTAIYPTSLFLERLQQDLGEKDSRVRSHRTDEVWHEKASDILVRILSKKGAEAKALLEMPLIPVVSKGWICAQEQVPVFWPTTDTKIEIPQDSNLLIDLFDLSAVGYKMGEEDSRHSFFKMLGVRTCPENSVITAISTRYQALTMGGNPPAWEDTMKHLLFLFESSQQGFFSRTPFPLYLETKYCLWSGDWILHTEMGHRIYFPNSEDAYSAFNVLKDLQQLWPYGPPFCFLHPDYLRCGPNQRNKRNQTWTEWLENELQIQSTQQISRRCKTGLSEEIGQLILRCSERFLEVLRRFWHQYRNFEGFDDQLSGLDFFSQSNNPKTLRTLYIPSPKLLPLKSQIGAPNSLFLKTPEELTTDWRKKWEILLHLGVKDEADLDFYMQTLRNHRSTKTSSTPSPEVLGNIYLQIMALSDREHRDGEIRKAFREESLIYGPCHETEGWSWTSPTLCVVKGHSWMTQKVCLDEVPQYKKVMGFFSNTMEIRDACVDDFFDELRAISWQTTTDAKKCAKIYQAFAQAEIEDMAKLREIFMREQLIYSDSDCRWHRLGECTWAGNHDGMLGYEGIRDQYVGLENFFCETLGLCAPDIKMQVQALKELADSSSPVAEDLRKGIRRVAAMNPSKDDVAPLQNCAIFPVKINTRYGVHVRLVRRDDMFLIADNEELSKSFYDRLDLLSFSVKEVLQSKPFFASMGLDDRMLSEIAHARIQTKTEVLCDPLTKAFRQRARILTSYAIQYSGEDFAAKNSTVLEKLQHAKVYLADEITKHVTATQHDRSEQGCSIQTRLDLRETDSAFEIVLPSQDELREVCYRRDLPQSLAKMFRMQDVNTQLIMQGVLTCHSPLVVCQIMEGIGLAEGPWKQMDGLLSMTVQSRPEIIKTSDSEQEDAAMPPDLGFGLNQWADVDPSMLVAPPTDIRSRSPSPSDCGLDLEETESESGRSRYGEILDTIIRHAKRDFQSEDEAAENVFSKLEPRSKSERDRKIGAAGEAYVFETLLNLKSKLPRFNFGEENWKSSIRHLVNVHDKYTRLEKLERTEESDFVYHDEGGQLTQWLCELGAFRPGFEPLNTAPHPTYFLEVKSTTKACSAPFYLSKAQYKMMNRRRVGTDRQGKEIFVIFRVFNLGSKDVGFKVFADAHAWNAAGHFREEPDTWLMSYVPNPALARIRDAALCGCKRQRSSADGADEQRQRKRVLGKALREAFL